MRQDILQAVAEEINSRGFKFTMSDLTKRLCVSKSSLYEHFASKTELIAAFLDAVFTDMEQQETEIYQSELPTLEKFKTVLGVTPKVLGPLRSQVLDDLRTAYPSEWQRVRDFNHQRLDRLTALLQQGIADGIVRPIPFPILRELIIAGMNAIAAHRFLAENNMTYADAISQLTDLITHGLEANIA